MARRNATYFPQRINMRVPSMASVGATEGDDAVTADFGAPSAKSATLLLSAQSIATATGVTTFNTYVGSEAQMGRWGRGLTVVASGAATTTVTITGRDYLNQRAVETLTLNGTTAVNGVKAFRYVDRIDWAATASTTINVGTTDVMGLPFKGKAMFNEVKNGAAAANAGTFVAGLANATAATATNADTRGTYLPVTVVPDGTNTFEVRYIADNTNMHGNRHFAG
jgi:hypothetical protein